ncbi:MAG: CCA tRNA nucleotidyltransferase [bacterium]
MSKEIIDFVIPEEIIEIVVALKKSGYEAYIVGGSVRDMLLQKHPKDWDIATNALPEEIQRLFPDSVYENTFGTVGVKTRSNDPTLKVVEVTTFRTESEYSDSRHPDAVIFTQKIEEDLSRRDFTVNAMALAPDNSIIDPYGGQKDLGREIIRAVGDPTKRFQEDALRLIRAIRFASELGFSLEAQTLQSLKENADLLKNITEERIRDEFKKIIMSDGDGPMIGIIRLEQTKLLQYIIPELRIGIGVMQNKHHIYTVWEHNLRALDYTAHKNYSFDVRLAALFHDIGKPHTKAGDGENATFYAHEIVGAKITRKILERMHFSKQVIQYVTHLVRQHLFYYNVGEVTEAGVRRFIRRVGEDTIDDLLKIREADRIGSGVPKAVPYKNRHLKFMIDKVRTDPVGPKMLKLNGSELMDALNITPCPRIGKILAILLEQVLDNTQMNTKDRLIEEARILNEKTDEELGAMARKARDTKEEYESGIEEKMKSKYYVK